MAMSIARSLLYGFVNLLHPRMLWLMVWPMLVALAIWGTAALLLWVRTAVWLGGLLQQWLAAAPFVARFDLGDATLIAAHVVLFLLFVPLVYLTALFILGVFGMQAMVDHVARRSYPAARAAPRRRRRRQRLERLRRARRHAAARPRQPAAVARAAALAADHGGDPRLGEPAPAALRRARRARRRGGDAARLPRPPRLAVHCSACCWRWSPTCPSSAFSRRSRSASRSSTTCSARSPRKSRPARD